MTETEQLFTMSKFMGAYQKENTGLTDQQIGFYYWYWKADFNPVLPYMDIDEGIVINSMDSFCYHDSKVIPSLLFNSDWNWLIPVCSKCNDIVQNQERPSVNHCNDLDYLECEISIPMREYDMAKVFEACMNFINAYNNKNENR